jgi:hypothetical protein
VWEVANQRVHGTTHPLILENWETEKQREDKDPLKIAREIPDHEA